MRALAVVVAVVCWATAARARTPDAGPAAAAPTGERAAFYAALALAQDGAPAEAAAALLALTARAPGDLFADDALAEAARLHEERLGDPARALALYERLLAEYPGSRLATRAERRAEILRRGVGPGGQGAAAQAAWNDILYGYTGRDPEASIVLAEKLLAAHPDFPEAPSVALWIGERRAEAGERERAVRELDAVAARWPDAPAAKKARWAAAEVVLTLGRHDEAERRFLALVDPAASTAERVSLAEALEKVHDARRFARIERVAWVLAGLLLAAAIAVLRRDTGSWAAAARTVARPPVEVLYVIPVLVLLGAATLTENEGISHTTLVVGAATLVTSWLSGAGLTAARVRAGRVTLARALGHGGGAALVVACAAYIAAQRTGMLGFIVHTVQFGHD